MSPKTTPKAERPSAGRVPEIAGRAIATLSGFDTGYGPLTWAFDVTDISP